MHFSTSRSILLASAAPGDVDSRSLILALRPSRSFMRARTRDSAAASAFFLRSSRSAGEGFPASFSSSVRRFVSSSTALDPRERSSSRSAESAAIWSLSSETLAWVEALLESRAPHGFLGEGALRLLRDRRQAPPFAFEVLEGLLRLLQILLLLDEDRL